MTDDSGAGPRLSSRWDDPELGPSPSTRFKGKLLMAWGLTLAAAMVVGFPVMIIFGVISLQQASQIKAHGIVTYGTVVNQIRNYHGGGNYCNGANVAYTTKSGLAEQGSVGTQTCLATGTPVTLVYDPSAPNVVQFANQRGSTTGAWGTIGAGGFFTLLCWGLIAPAVWKKQRRDFRARRAARQSAAAATT
jgi:hypothetical protein